MWNNTLNRRSREAADYRKRYKTARWRRIREEQLATHPLCATCAKAGRITPATVCNHLNEEAKATEQGFFAGPYSSLSIPAS